MISFAESLFCADSLTTLSLLKSTLPEEVVSAISILDLLQGFGLNASQQLAFLSAHQMDKKALAGFRQHKAMLLSLGEAIEQNKLDTISEEGFILSTAFSQRRPFIQAYTAEIAQANFSPIDSIIHMHCNRFLGKDLVKEKKARLFAEHLINTMHEKNRSLKLTRHQQSLRMEQQLLS